MNLFCQNLKLDITCLKPDTILNFEFVESARIQRLVSLDPKCATFGPVITNQDFLSFTIVSDDQVNVIDALSVDSDITDLAASNHSTGIQIKVKCLSLLWRPFRLWKNYL